MFFETITKEIVNINEVIRIDKDRVTTVQSRQFKVEDVDKVLKLSKFVKHGDTYFNAANIATIKKTGAMGGCTILFKTKSHSTAVTLKYDEILKQLIPAQRKARTKSKKVQ